MKRDLVLLIDADADTYAATFEAARMAGLDVRYEQTWRHLLKGTESRLHDIAVIVLDVDAGTYGTTMLQALDAWDPRRPMILISSLVGTRFHPVARASGTVEYLSKPVSIERLKAAIEKFAQTPGVHRCRSDEWGRLCEGCDRSRGKVEKDYALFAEEY